MSKNAEPTGLFGTSTPRNGVTKAMQGVFKLHNVKFLSMYASVAYALMCAVLVVWNDMSPITSYRSFHVGLMVSIVMLIFESVTLLILIIIPSHNTEYTSNDKRENAIQGATTVSRMFVYVLSLIVLGMGIAGYFCAGGWAISDNKIITDPNEKTAVTIVMVFSFIWASAYIALFAMTIASLVCPAFHEREKGLSGLQTTIDVVADDLPDMAGF